MENELFELLKNQRFDEGAELVEKYTPQALAEVLNELTQADESLLVPFCRAIESDLLADVLVLLDKSLQQKIIGGLHDDELEKVMDEVSVDDTVDIIEDMPEALVRRIAELDEIMMLLKERNYPVLKPLLASMNAIDLAEVFEETESDTDLLILFRLLPKDLAAETFVEMDTDVAARLIGKLSSTSSSSTIPSTCSKRCRQAWSNVCSRRATWRRAPISTRFCATRKTAPAAS